MMKNTLLVGVLIVLGIAVTTFNPPISFLLAVGAWIYLVTMVRKQRTSLLNNHMEPEITELSLKRVKAFLIVAGFSFLICVVAASAHNVLHDLSERVQTVSLLIALFALWVFVIATAGGMIIFLKERQQTTQQS
jgi:hypothetical protein